MNSTLTAGVRARAEIGDRLRYLRPVRAALTPQSGEQARAAMHADVVALRDLHVAAGYDEALVETTVCAMHQAVTGLLQLSCSSLLVTRTDHFSATYDAHDRSRLHDYAMRRPFRRAVLLPHDHGGFFRVAISVRIGDEFDDHDTFLRVHARLRHFWGDQAGELANRVENAPEVAARCRTIESFAHQLLIR